MIQDKQKKRGCAVELHTLLLKKEEREEREGGRERLSRMNLVLSEGKG